MEKIRITCKADEFLPFQQIQDFQGELKSRTQDDVDHLISSIETHGFSFPFFVWRQPDGVCSCLDGHGRIMALQQLENEGCEIPELPVVYIDANDEAEARTKLIHINTVSGRFTDSGFRELVKDIPDLDLASYKYPDLDLEKIDIELKVLAQAEASIQESVKTNWDEVFADSEPFSSELPVDVPDGFVSPVPASAGPMPGSSMVSDATVQVLSSSDGPDDSDVEEEGAIRELVVYCPECSKSFIYQYKK